MLINNRSIGGCPVMAKETEEINETPVKPVEKPDFAEMRDFINKWHCKRAALMVQMPVSPVVTAFGTFLGGGIVFMVTDNPVYLLASLILGLMAGAIMSSENNKTFKKSIKELEKDKKILEEYQKALDEEDIRQIRMKNKEIVNMDLFITEEYREISNVPPVSFVASLCPHDYRDNFFNSTN
ncbi:MAG: hypothetical protein ABRQ37_11660 [Candidatus Eremiobacterota bacterium]